MFTLDFFPKGCIYIVLVVCVNTGMVMSKGKMPAVKEKAYISHSQNHQEKKTVSKVLNFHIFPFLQLQVNPSGSEPPKSRGTTRPAPCCADKLLLVNTLRESRHITGSILILKLIYVILVITAIFQD